MMENEGGEALTDNDPNVGGDGNVVGTGDDNDSLGDILHPDDDVETENLSHNSVEQAGLRVE